MISHRSVKQFLLSLYFPYRGFHILLQDICRPHKFHRQIKAGKNEIQTAARPRQKGKGNLFFFLPERLKLCLLLQFLPEFVE